MPTLPHVKIGNLSVSKLIVGGNPFSGISHQSNEADEKMIDYYTADRIKKVLAECERLCINTGTGRANK
jgi:hypothetical protein